MEKDHNKKRKALIIISSATILPLSMPKGHSGISTGFFLVELAKVLQAFEDTHEFIFATPDGKTPQLDINGLALSLHAQDNMGAAMGGAIFDQMFNFNVDQFRSKRPELIANREKELLTLYSHLGKIPLSQPLPNTDKEVKFLYQELLQNWKKLPEHPFFSIKDLVDKNRDIQDNFKLKDFDFVHLPGGHAPMVDFHENPYLGELLNTLGEHNILISLICHGPVALTSAKYRVSESGLVSVIPNHHFKNAKITVSSAFAEMIAVKIAYHKIQGKKTRLEFIVEDVLKKEGYQVDVKLNPMAVQVIYDKKFNLLTGNGPQAMRTQTDKLIDIVAALI
ncbi:Molecular chaperone Hsp31 and glyoxalase 3 [compost metagenome]